MPSGGLLAIVVADISGTSDVAMVVIDFVRFVLTKLPAVGTGSGISVGFVEVSLAGFFGVSVVGDSAKTVGVSTMSVLACVFVVAPDEINISRMVVGALVLCSGSGVVNL